MRRLWIIAGSLLAVAALVAGTFTVVNLVAREEVIENATFSATGVTHLDVDGENGRVDVVGDGESEITVEARITHGLRRTGHRAAVEGATLRVEASCPRGLPVRCRVDYRIVVPSRLAASVRNHNGAITVRDIDGAVDVATSNGAIDLARVGGRLQARTSNGSIRGRGLRTIAATARTSNGSVELAFSAPPEGVDARTSNGAIEVVVPDDANTYRIDADVSFFGSTDNAIRSDPTSDRSIRARTSNGGITVRYPTG